MLTLVLFIIAAVLFALASFSPSKTPIHLGWAGAAVLAIGLAAGGA